MLRVANAPCSWGVIENIEGERYDYVRVLDEIAASGYGRDRNWAIGNSCLPTRHS